MKIGDIITHKTINYTIEMEVVAATEGFPCFGCALSELPVMSCVKCGMQPFLHNCLDEQGNKVIFKELELI